MTKITMELIKELREKTQVGMMDCKKALIEAEGDLEKAVDILRKKGAAVAAKRASNEINNGHIESCVSADGKTGVLLKIGCETDFSANTEAMKEFAKEICQHILKKSPKCIEYDKQCPECCEGESLLNQKLENEKITVLDKLNDLISKISEKIKIEEFVRFSADKNGIISSYIHPGANIGILVQLETDKELDQSGLKKVEQLGHDICMQIAVTTPLSILPEELDKKTLEKEQGVIKEQLIAAGKPENMIEKIMIGKLNKFYEDVCLYNQKFIKNDKISIKQYIEEVSKDAGTKIQVKQFARFAVGK